MQRKKPAILRSRTQGKSHLSTSPHITVAVRVRPLSDKEALDPRNKPVVEVMDEHMICFDPSGSTVPQGKVSNSISMLYSISSFKKRVMFGISGARPSKSSHKGIASNFHRARDQKYAFDHVFDCQSRQQEVYEKTARPLIDPVLNGYNATVFAYGATGSGKT